MVLVLCRSCGDRPAPCNDNNLAAPGPNPQVLYGALVGGPDQNDFYEDERNDYVKNEVANDYNSGYQSAIAGLSRLYLNHRRGLCTFANR